MGHLINENGISLLPKNISAIKEFPVPKTFGWVRRFLGLNNFYHRFIENCAEILQPPNDLMKGYKRKSFHNKVAVCEQNDEALRAFSKVKGNLAAAALYN